MRRIAKLLVGLGVIGAAGAAQAQSFNQEWQRYRASKFECAERHRQRVEGNCDAICRRAADDRQAHCLAAAERRYEDALRRALRSPR